MTRENKIISFINKQLKNEKVKKAYANWCKITNSNPTDPESKIAFYKETKDDCVFSK